VAYRYFYQATRSDLQPLIDAYSQTGQLVHTS